MTKFRFFLSVCSIARRTIITSTVSNDSQKPISDICFIVFTVFTTHHIQLRNWILTRTCERMSVTTNIIRNFPQCFMVWYTMHGKKKLWSRLKSCSWFKQNSTEKQQKMMALFCRWYIAIESWNANLNKYRYYAKVLSYLWVFVWCCCLAF